MEISESGSMRCGVKSNLQCWLFPVRSVQRQNFYFPYFDHVQVISFSTYEKERERERYHCVGIILHTPLGSKTECSDLFFFFLFRALLTAGRFVSSENRNPDTARHATPRHATRTRVHARVNQRENTLVGGERTSIRLFRWSPFFPWQSMRWLLGLKKTTTTTSICPIASFFSRCTVLFRFCSFMTEREYVRPGHRKS